MPSTGHSMTRFTVGDGFIDAADGRLAEVEKAASELASYDLRAAVAHLRGVVLAGQACHGAGLSPKPQGGSGTWARRVCATVAPGESRGCRPARSGG